ncbi:Transcriptional regulator/sugar kinase [Planctomycetales bacterium 10988]|nr:Transcriptional regulator/sugar kinase [Planctomycetales bacterium 10988]
MLPLVGGIEAGGTKFVCAVGTGPEDIRDEVRFPTTTPAETIGQAISFFQEQQAKHGELQAMGIGSFGPVDPNPQSPDYGKITTTPKPGWQNADFVGKMKEAFPVPTGFDTDVNGAALGEHKWGAGKGLDTFLYFTIGTGIGGGGLVNGKLMHGLIHPEMGHIQMPRDPEKDPYKGKCPYHGDCFEGLAAGPAIEERWKMSAKSLPPEHPAWDLEAYYIATAMRDFICTISPQRLILGGGVMDQEHLFPMIHKKVLESLNGYVQSPAILDNIEEYIVPPALGNQAGIAGAFALAQLAME